MPNTVHDTLLERIVAALSAAPALSEWVLEDDATTVPEDAVNYIVVSMVSSSPSDAGITGAPINWDTDLAVDCYARSEAGSNATKLARALHAAAFARLYADASLGGAVMDLRPGPITIDQELRGTRIACCTGRYRALHRSAANTLD